MSQKQLPQFTDADNILEESAIEGSQQTDEMKERMDHARLDECMDLEAFDQSIELSSHAKDYVPFKKNERFPLSLLEKLDQ